MEDEGHWKCANGHIVRDEEAESCPQCGESLQWVLPRSKPSLKSLDSGEPGFAPPSPWSYLIVGVVFTAFGWLAVAQGDGSLSIFGALLLLIGSIATGIGVVAEGVRIGRLNSR